MIKSSESGDSVEITFFSEHDAIDPRSLTVLEPAIRAIFDSEKFSLSTLNVIVVGDERILEVNRTHLDHDYYTDVITFEFSSDPVDGELYISYDTVYSNSMRYGTSFNQELMRVVFHGCLHLCGYKDKSKEEKRQMREREDYYLDMFSSLRVV